MKVRCGCGKLAHAKLIEMNVEWRCSNCGPKSIHVGSEFHNIHDYQDSTFTENDLINYSERV